MQNVSTCRKILGTIDIVCLLNLIAEIVVSKKPCRYCKRVGNNHLWKESYVYVYIVKVKKPQFSIVMVFPFMAHFEQLYDKVLKMIGIIIILLFPNLNLMI